MNRGTIKYHRLRWWLSARSLVILFGLFLILSACGKKAEVRPSPEAVRAKEAFQLAEKLRTAYLIRDRSRFEALTTRKGYLKIIGSIREFDSATLEFTPRWVDMEGTRVILYINWKGTWKKAGKSYSDEGLSTFVLEGSPLRLDDILRANPFSRPEI